MTDLSGAHPEIALEGGRKARKNLTRSRIWFSVGVLVLVFAVICGRLIQLGIERPADPEYLRANSELTLARPALVDRNGEPLALDIEAPSLYAEPKNIIDIDEAVEKLHSVLPQLSTDFLRQRLDGDEGFVWLERELSPAMQEKVLQLGLPGVDFVNETKRYYPGGSDASHLLGTVNIDNQGISGIERYLDRKVLNTDAERPDQVQLSIDLRVQHALHAELEDSMTRYQAIAAAGVLINVKTGEVMGLVSLPDFDPNEPATALEEGRINRITAGTFELGSTFKTVTFAGALDSGAVHITDRFDATHGVRFGRFVIDDFHGQHRVLSVPEIFKYSSNVGTIHLMQAWGKDNYRAFLHRMGFDEPLPIELPETKRSTIPSDFSEIVAATASFGHGISVTPLHMASAIAAFVNDGVYLPATLFPRSTEEAAEIGRHVISPEASALVRYLLRLNAMEGTATHMNRIADGYLPGGKTGTAEKVENGRYVSNKNFNAFAAAFPLDNPQYALVVVIDEPKRENPQSGDTAGWNAGEVAGRIIKRVAPMLGIAPEFDESVDQSLVPAVLR
ncbi:MAG: penicillin-binding protein 2 [Hyphomicrobiaceae bacterium]|nr:penicillin-binding protein 2 [Hyphomicrobiaceae bacterium]MCC0024888.1 penicillin-binding protein 2 [Hyphomicrobiaceae bacterium]